MKKEFEEKLILVVMVVIGVLCFLSLCENARQIDKNMEKTYERVN